MAPVRWDNVGVHATHTSLPFGKIYVVVIIILSSDVLYNLKETNFLSTKKPFFFNLPPAPLVSPLTSLFLFLSVGNFLFFFFLKLNQI